MSTSTMSSHSHKRKRSSSPTHNTFSISNNGLNNKTENDKNHGEPPQKKRKRELTIKLNSFYNENALKSRPKNEYVHIETLYNYSKPFYPLNKHRYHKELNTMDNKEQQHLNDTYSDDSFDNDVSIKETQMEIEIKAKQKEEIEHNNNNNNKHEEEEEKPSILQRSFMNHIELSSLSYYDRERLSRMKLSLLYIKCCIAVLRPNSPTFPKQNELHRWLDSKNHPPLTRIDIRQARKALKDDYNILLHSNSNKLTDKYTTLYQAQEAMKQIYESAKSKCIGNTENQCDGSISKEHRTPDNIDKKNNAVL